MQVNPFEIIFFPLFRFKNGANPLPKFFISIKNIDNGLVVASLPTSQDHIPNEIKVEGCIEYPDRCISCFCFFENKTVCEDTGFKFLKDTFIYSNTVDTLNLSTLNEYYPVKDIDYFIKGKLSSDLQKDLMKCLKNSFHIKRGIKKLL